MEKFKFYRKKSGLTLDEAANLLGISRNTLSAYESGKISPPLTVIIRMLKEYHSNTFDMLGVNVPEKMLTAPQTVYELFCEYANAATNRMETSLMRSGHRGYSKERKAELYNQILCDALGYITDAELRDEVMKLHNKTI